MLNGIEDIANQIYLLHLQLQTFILFTLRKWKKKTEWKNW